MIDFKNKIIFIHIPKTGGTSIEASLRKDLQQQAFPNGIGRYRRRADKKPQRVTGMGKNGYHSSLQHIKEDDGEGDTKRGIPPVRIEDYFSFSVIRNPWDREYSLFRFCFIDPEPLRKVKTPPTFEEYLKALKTFKETGDNTLFREWRQKGTNWNQRQGPQGKFHRPIQTKANLPSHIFTDQWNYLTINNRLKINHLIRFETLEEDYSELRHRLKRDPQKLPHERKGRYREGNSGPTHYKDAYTPDLRDRVAALRHKDITEFNYSF